MSHTATLVLSYTTSDRAKRVAQSLRPEVGDIEDERMTTSLTRDEQGVELFIEASDLVALRAGLNTWLTLAAVAERTGVATGDDRGAGDAEQNR